MNDPLKKLVSKIHKDNWIKLALPNKFYNYNRLLLPLESQLHGSSLMS